MEQTSLEFCVVGLIDTFSLTVSSTPSKSSMTEWYKNSRHLSVANTSGWIMKKSDKQKDVICAKIRASQF